MSKHLQAFGGLLVVVAVYIILVAVIKIFWTIGAWVWGLW